MSSEETGEDSTVFIDPSDVLVEVDDVDDRPMDEDDHDPTEEDDDIVYENDEDIAEEGTEYENTSIARFDGHKGSVFAVTVHPTQPLVVSGGEDDLGYIWDVRTGTEIVRLTGHTDSVTAVGWSFDGELVSTGGMDGRVRIWRHVQRDNDADWKTWEFLTDLAGPEEIMWLTWHPRGLVLLAGSSDSTIWLWQLPSGNTMQVMASHTGPVHAGCFTPDGKRILTGSETLLLTSPTSESPLLRLTSTDGRFALGGITALAVNSSNSLAVVGGAEGDVRVVSLLKGDVMGTLVGHTQGESIESVAWMTYAGTEVAVTGGTDGKICLWDLGTMRLRITMEHSDSITSLHPHQAPSAYLLTSSSADKTLRTWDVRTGTIVQEHKGHRGPILAASLSDVHNVVVSAGDDGACLVFALA